jgi:DNA-binding MarR family transcriptional regulator
VTWCSDGDRIDQDTFDAMTEFLAGVVRLGDGLAQELGLSVPCIKAIHLADESITMKELGERMHCDPSFVTAVADELERRGLARREPHAADRRIKDLVLTPEGLDLKARVERVLLSRVPWARGLDASERESLLAMVTKMNSVMASLPASGGTSRPRGSAQPSRRN